METEIIAALIGACAVIIGAIIAAISKISEKKSTSDGNGNTTVTVNDNLIIL